MFGTVNSAACAIFFAPQASPLGAGYAAICHCHPLVMPYVPFICTKVVRFIAGKLSAANALVNAVFLPVQPVVNNRCMALCLRY